MKIKNLKTGIEYSMPKTSWEELGKSQKLFVVVDKTDEVEKPIQYIDNKAVPTTGNKLDEKNTLNKSKKQDQEQTL